MALSYSLDGPVQYEGTKRVVRGTITFDSSYPTGGEAVTVASLGLVKLEDLTLSGDDGYVLRWNRSASSPLILAYMGDNNNASDGPLIEVANTTDLSAVVTRFTAVGV